MGLPADAHPRLLAGLPRLLRTVVWFKAPSTMWRYGYSWKHWLAFAGECGVVAVPADPLHVALYLTEVVAGAKTFSVVRLASAAVAAFHHAVGLPSPTDATIVHSVREAAQRLLPDGAGKKEPMALEHLERICERFAGSDCTLADLVVCTAMSFGFFGFLRYADLAVVVADELLFAADDSWADVFLEERKTDQFREGQWVVLSAYRGSPACPVSLARRLLARARPAPGAALFSAVRGEAYASSAPIPYGELRSLFLEKFAAIGLDTSKFGTHSCRAGGATLAANLGVPDRMWREHGGWRSLRAATGYVKSSHESKLAVTRAMVGEAAGGRGRGRGRGARGGRASAGRGRGRG